MRTVAIDAMQISMKPTNKTIIPAQIGFFIIDAQEDGSLKVTEPVLAWLMVHEEIGTEEDSPIIDMIDVEPITCSGLASGLDKYFGLLNPDGEVDRPYYGSWDSFGKAQNFYKANLSVFKNRPVGVPFTRAERKSHKEKGDDDPI